MSLLSAQQGQGAPKQRGEGQQEHQIAVRWLARLAWFTLAYNVLVILWGAYVRISGSGAGCGDHWPLCDGHVVPPSFTVQRVIEFSHRATSGLSGLFAIGLVGASFWATPKGHPVRLGAALTLGLIVLEGLVGGMQVLLGLTANSTDPARGLVQGVHLANTFLLLAAMLLTALWAGGAPKLRWPVAKSDHAWLRWAVPLITGAMLLLGMAGAVTALGDKLFMPAPGTPLDTLRRDFGHNGVTGLIQQLRVVHPLLAVVVCALLLWFVDKVKHSIAPVSPTFLRAGYWLYAVIALQIGAGLLNVALKAPGWLQLVHLALASVMWLLVVLLMYLPLTEHSSLPVHEATQEAPA